MRRCIIHIGVPKTGSTAIQLTLRKNAAALENAGILYRTTLDSSNLEAKHQRLAMELLRDRESGRVGLDRVQLGELLSQTSMETVVLSSEAFSDPEMDAARIADFLDFIRAHDFEPTALVYVRAQPPLANSTYTQRIKTFNFTGSFSEFLHLQLGGKDWRYSERLAPWTEQRGLRLVVAPFTPENTGPDIAARMLLMAGAPADQIAAAAMAPARNVNETPGPVAVAAFRLLMRMRPREKKAWRSSSASREAVRQAKRRGWCEDRFVGLDEDALARIEDACERDNEAFARRFLDRPWKQVFAADYARTWRSNEIDLERIEPALRAELEAFVREHADAPKLPLDERRGPAKRAERRARRVAERKTASG